MMEQTIDKNNVLPLDLIHHLTLITYDDVSLYNESPITKFISFEDYEYFYQRETDRQYGMPKGKSYDYDKTIKKEEINFYIYRSEEFTNDHNGKHVLFAGDSNTWGTGLLYEEQWSRKLYKTIAKDKEVSGYFNIGCVASSIFHSIITIFKYCKQFGNPDCIFFNMHKLNSFYAYDQELNKITDAWYKRHPVIDLLSYHYYFMLDQYCESNNIKLLSFTGYDAEPPMKKALFESRIDQFKTFYKIDEDEMTIFIKEYKDNNKHLEEAKYFDKARDGEHDGIAYHAYWAEFMYKKYLEL
jgi:hypothetical protein